MPADDLTTDAPQESAPARSRWADTDALGQTIKEWVAARGSDRVASVASAASDRELRAALLDYRLAQGDREGLDARLVDVFREVEKRLWRANGGALQADARERVFDELDLATSESRPEVYAVEAARYLARWGREPHASDCACPVDVPGGAELEAAKADAEGLRAAVGEAANRIWVAFSAIDTAFSGPAQDAAHEELDNAIDALRSIVTQPSRVDSAEAAHRELVAEKDKALSLALAERDEARAEVARLRRMIEHAVPWRVSEEPTDDEMRALRLRWAFGLERYQADADALIAAVMHGRETVAKLRAVAQCARRERAARAAWLESLPAGSCGNPPPRDLIDAEAATGAALASAVKALGPCAEVPA